MAMGNEQNIAAIEAHIEKHLGPSPTVFHELISDKVHIDLHVVPPTEARPFYSVVTSGMSDKPMNVPEGCEELRYAELMICLPPDWPMEDKDWKDENNYWPIRLLKFLARMPHEYDTFLSLWHTVPNGDPPEKLGDTDFLCAYIGGAETTPEDFWQLKIDEQKTIIFLGVYPLYKEEMDLKMKKGAEALEELFEKNKITELLDVKRKNVAKKRFGIF